MVPEKGEVVMKQTVRRPELGGPSVEGWFPRHEDWDPEGSCALPR